MSKLLTQTEARAEAKRLNEVNRPTGMVWVAVAVPERSWGGHEKGWTTKLLKASNQK